MAGGPAKNPKTDLRCREARILRGPGRAYSAAIRIRQGIDGRSKAGRVLIATRRALIAHLGGEDRLSPPQRALVERCAALQLSICALDQRIIDGTFTDYDSKTYLAWSNSLTRCLVALSAMGNVTTGPSLNDVLAGIASRRQADDDDLGDDEIDDEVAA
jgi:hypothetical protein